MQETSTPDPTAAEVRAGLARRGLTQEDLARHLNLSRTAVGRRLDGSVLFNTAELRNTAELIGVPAETLINPPALTAPATPEGGDAA